MSGDWTSGISIALMAERFTPKQAAHIKYEVLALRECVERGPEDDRIDALLENDPGHRWFCFCLDAVARMEVPAP